MKWILLLFLGAQLIGTVEFENEPACERAKDLIEQVFKETRRHRGDDDDNGKVPRLVCLAKGLP